jgi:predicted HicB family RNase H-like nuclease
MKRETVSVRVDPELWKRAKIYAVERDQTLGDLIERLLRELLKCPQRGK